MALGTAQKLIFDVNIKINVFAGEGKLLHGADSAIGSNRLSFTFDGTLH